MEQNPEFGCLKEAFVQARVGRGREEALEKTIEAKQTETEIKRVFTATGL